MESLKKDGYSSDSTLSSPPGSVPPMTPETKAPKLPGPVDSNRSCSLVQESVLPSSLGGVVVGGGRNGLMLAPEAPPNEEKKDRSSELPSRDTTFQETRPESGPRDYAPPPALLAPKDEEVQFISAKRCQTNEDETISKKAKQNHETPPIEEQAPPLVLSSDEHAVLDWMRGQEQDPNRPHGGILLHRQLKERVSIIETLAMGRQPKKILPTLVIVSNKEDVGEWKEYLHNEDPAPYMAITTYAQVRNHHTLHFRAHSNPRRKTARRKGGESGDSQTVFDMKWRRVVWDDCTLAGNQKPNSRSPNVFQIIGDIKAQDRWFLVSGLWPQPSKVIWGLMLMFSFAVEASTQNCQHSLSQLAFQLDAHSAEGPFHGVEEIVVPASSEELLLHRVISRSPDDALQASLHCHQLLSNVLSLDNDFVDKYRGSNTLRELCFKIKQLPSRKGVLQILYQEATDSSSRQARYELGLDAMHDMENPDLEAQVQVEKLLAALYAEADCAEGECVSCGSGPDKEEDRIQTTQCGHLYCQECFRKSLSLNDKWCACYGCDSQLSLTGRPPNIDQYTREVTQMSMDHLAGIDGKGNCPVKPGPLWPFEVLRRVGRIPTILSTKLMATLSVILTWHKKSPMERIVAVVEYKPSARAMGELLCKMKIPFLYMLEADIPKTGRAGKGRSGRPKDGVVIISSLSRLDSALEHAVLNRVVGLDIPIHDLQDHRTRECLQEPRVSQAVCILSELEKER